MLDVAVIGGGPAGASCAMRLQQFGLAVALFEKGEGRRQHVGESLPSSIRVVLESLELTLPDEVVEPRPPEHFVYWGPMSGSGARARQHQETSLLVWRGPFDAFLRDTASERGVHIIDAPVSRVRPIEEGHALDCGGGETRACRFVVDASGRSGVVAKAYRQRVEGLRTLALTGHFDTFETGEASPTTIVETFADGWVWSAPLQNGLRDVTVMVDGDAVRTGYADADAVYQAAIDRAPHIRSMVECRKRVDPVRGIDATPYGASPFCARDFLLVGDAASFLDPLSAHGVHKAMDGAIVAAAVVRTILENPSMAEEAALFYDSREQDIFDITRSRLARLYRQETRFADRPFWTKRAVSDEPPPEPPAPRAPLTPTTPLRAGNGVEVVEAPVLENDMIERREVLVAAGLVGHVSHVSHVSHVRMRRPVRYLGNILLPDLFRVATAAGTAAQAARAVEGAYEPTYAAIDWLYRHGYLDVAHPH